LTRRIAALSRISRLEGLVGKRIQRHLACIHSREGGGKREESGLSCKLHTRRRHGTCSTSFHEEDGTSERKRGKKHQQRRRSQERSGGGKEEKREKYFGWPMELGKKVKLTRRICGSNINFGKENGTRMIPSMREGKRKKRAFQMPRGEKGLLFNA